MDNKENNNPKEQPGVDIELPEELAEGTYVNFSIIAHSDSEFVIDFVRIIPGIPKGRIKARVVLNPVHAKQLTELLRTQVQMYEKQFGEIHTPGKLVLNINNPIGEA